MFQPCYPLGRPWISLTLTPSSGGAGEKRRSDLPEAIQHFLLNNIDSIAKLEALLLLKSRPGQVWTPELLARRLYIAQSHTTQILADLTALGFCSQLSTSPPQYQYQPGTPENKTLLEQLAELYSTDLIAITLLVHQHGSGVQQFSDSFKLKKEPEA